MAGLEAHFDALKAKGREQGIIYDPVKGKIYFSWFLWKVGLVAQEFSLTLEALDSLPVCDRCFILFIPFTNLRRES